MTKVSMKGASNTQSSLERQVFSLIYFNMSIPSVKISIFKFSPVDFLKYYLVLITYGIFLLSVSSLSLEY